ncbi:hypothetical protein K4K56_004483 [Colletotrichum sp. SAR 10_98]|nr:hypothetical protein K4K56_004483 [Colletotrichum sp. SAR 10_98]
MNCPSRTDECTLEHPDWNQNPPFLAPDLTTCEDLNGIANAREHRRGTDGTGDGSDGRGDDMNYQTLPRLQPDRRAPVSGGWNHATFKRSARVTRRSTCPTGGLGDEDKYNTPLHVGALFIILGVSFLACAFPLIASRIPGVRIPRPFFFAVRHFGTGVLLATAFVHLLPTAFTLLGNPCLSSFWVEDYPAMPGAIALAGIFLVTLIEMAFSPARHMSHTPDASVLGPHRPESADEDDHRDPGSYPLEMAPSRGARRNSIGRTLSRIGRDDQAHEQAGDRLAKRVDEESRAVTVGVTHGIVLTPAQQHQKDILQCMMLEVGILFHSVFIGMTLSVSVGHEFVILLIAIAFHQTFEGLALGSRIASISWPEGSLQPWMMALAYGCTTPIGQAIGLATHRLYSPDSEFGLILVGTMNAISSGLLVFAALIELLAEDFLSDESWRILRGRKRVYACLLVFFGAFGMSLVGAWA